MKSVVLGFRRFLIPGRQPIRTFATFQSAAAGTAGYEDPDIVDVVARKTLEMRDSATITISQSLTSQDLLVLQRASEGDSVRVLDVGGACGATFFELDALSPDSIREWCVVDTPAMVARAQRDLGSDRLMFSTDLESALARSFDLVVAKGVVQYTPEPVAFLKSLISGRTTYVYLSRTPVFTSLHPQKFFRQKTRLRDHGPGSLADVSDRWIEVATSIAPWRAYLAAIGPERIVWIFDEGNRWTLEGAQVQDMGILVRT